MTDDPKTRTERIANRMGATFVSREDFEKTTAEVERLTRELDITNADHIALWLEANMHANPLGWLACRSAEAVMISVPISDVIASVAELGFAGREPEGYPGALAQCSCCGTMADKWTRIWSVLVGDCCFDKIVTPETPRRVITPYKPQKRWMW